MDRHLEEMKRLKSALAVAKKRLEAVTQNDPVVAQLQEHNGIGTPQIAPLSTDPIPRPPRCRSTHAAEIQTESNPAMRKPKSR